MRTFRAACLPCCIATGEIPGSRFVVLDAGHSTMSEAPRATLDALRDFLKTGDRPRF